MRKSVFMVLFALAVLAPHSLYADEGKVDYPDRQGLGSKVKPSGGKLPGLSDLFGKEKAPTDDKAMAGRPDAASDPETQSAPSTPEGALPMERVTGIGGFFFRSEDPDSLSQWYSDNLGVDVVPTDYDTLGWQQEPGTTIFAPFQKDTDYFGSSSLMWMINFRVRDLDAMVAQLRGNGIDVEVDPEAYPNGRFARLSDPEGNPIQLWQPGGGTER